MSLFTRFLKTISDVLPGLSGLSESEMHLLAKVNPEKIYIENVRSILGISHWSAVQILETGVRQGIFSRWVEVQCPDGSIAASAQAEESLPDAVRCWTEQEGHVEEVMLPTKSLRKTLFYRLENEADSRPYGRTA